MQDVRVDKNLPLGVKIGNGSMYCAAQTDITLAFLRTFAIPPLVVTAMGNRQDNVESACRACNVDAPLLFNIGRDSSDRDTVFISVVEKIAEALEQGRGVILHCHAGVHRAATLWAMAHMYLTRESFSAGRSKIEAIRATKIDEFLNDSWVACKRTKRNCVVN